MKRKSKPCHTRVPNKGKQPRGRAGPLRAKKYWSEEVTKHSFALDLQEGVFTWKNPERIAKSLKLPNP